MYKRKKIVQGIPKGEFRKDWPPIFDGIDKIGLEVEIWILGMERYFKIHNYTDNKKAIITIFNL